MQTRSLTLEQQNWLKVNAFLPVITIVVILAILAAIFICLFTGFTGVPFLPIFIGFAGLILLGVIISTVMHVYNHFMDLNDGVAQVRTGRLLHKHATSRAPRTFYAEFEGAGTVIVMGDIYEKLEEGQTYKVIFSPRTRRGWQVE